MGTETNYTSRDEIRRLSDRQLAEVSFLLLCALAERLTGKVPCIVEPEYQGMPRFIYGADAEIEWLSPSQGRVQKSEFAREPKHTPVPIPAREPDAV